MRKLATIAALVSVLATLTACGGTSHVGKLPPKPCRITSTKAACLAYLMRSLMKDTRPGHVYTLPAGVRIHPQRCPNRQYPALCKKH